MRWGIVFWTGWRGCCGISCDVGRGLGIYFVRGKLLDTGTRKVYGIDVGIVAVGRNAVGILAAGAS